MTELELKEATEKKLSQIVEEQRRLDEEFAVQDQQQLEDLRLEEDAFLQEKVAAAHGRTRQGGSTVAEATTMVDVRQRRASSTADSDNKSFTSSLEWGGSSQSLHYRGDETDTLGTSPATLVTTSSSLLTTTPTLKNRPATEASRTPDAHDDFNKFLDDVKTKTLSTSRATRTASHLSQSEEDLFGAIDTSLAGPT